MKKYHLSIISQQNKLKLQNYIITELIVFITSLINDHKVQKLSSGSVSTDADNDNDDNNTYNTDKLRLYRLIFGIAKWAKNHTVTSAQ